MNDLFDLLPTSAREQLKKTLQPAWTPPMLATLSDKPFSSKDWLFERKFDGERCLVFHTPGQMRLMSRNQKELNSVYPELVDRLHEQQGERFIADGEVVAFEGKRTSFALLQRRMQIRNAAAARRTGIAVRFYLFDLLYYSGYDISGLGQILRKTLLEHAFTFDRVLRYSEHRFRDGNRFFQAACRDEWEGLIAKRSDAPYVHARSTDWLKLKCSLEQEFVIGGYTEPQGSRVALGAVLVGYYDEVGFRFAGKVGTGYDEATLRWLHSELSKRQRSSSPFVDSDIPLKGIHWAEPELLVQVAFTEWTPTGKLRHPRFLGVRRDKRPQEVRREQGLK